MPRASFTRKACTLPEVCAASVMNSRTPSVAELNRGLADLLLAFGKVEIKRSARRAAGFKDVLQTGAVIAALAE